VLLVLFMIGNLWFNVDQNSTVVNQEETESLEQTQKSVSESQTDKAEVDETIEDTEEGNRASEDAKTTTQNIASSNSEEASAVTKQENEKFTPSSDKADNQLKTNGVAKSETISENDIKNNNQKIALLSFLNTAEKNK